MIDARLSTQKEREVDELHYVWFDGKKVYYDLADDKKLSEMLDCWIKRGLHLRNHAGRDAVDAVMVIDHILATRRIRDLKLRNMLLAEDEQVEEYRFEARE